MDHGFFDLSDISALLASADRKSSCAFGIMSTKFPLLMYFFHNSGSFGALAAEKSSSEQQTSIIKNLLS